MEKTRHGLWGVGRGEEFGKSGAADGLRYVVRGERGGEGVPEGKSFVCQARPLSRPLARPLARPRRSPDAREALQEITWRQDNNSSTGIQ